MIITICSSIYRRRGSSKMPSPVRSCIYFAEGTQYSVEHFTDEPELSERAPGYIGVISGLLFS